MKEQDSMTEMKLVVHWHFSCNVGVSFIVRRLKKVTSESALEKLTQEIEDISCKEAQFNEELNSATKNSAARNKIKTLENQVCKFFGIKWCQSAFREYISVVSPIDSYFRIISYVDLINYTSDI